MRNTIIVTIVLFATVVGASLYYFSDLGRQKTKTAEALALLPKDALLIAVFRNDAATENTFKGFEIFEAVLGREQTSRFQGFKNGFLQHPRVRPYVDGVEMYLSFHAMEEKTEVLLSIPTEGKISRTGPQELFRDLAEGFAVSSPDTLDGRIFRFEKDSGAVVFHAVLHRKVFFASRSKALLAKIMDEETPRIEGRQIECFTENRSRNAPLTVYLDHRQVPEIARHLMQGKYGKIVSLFDALDGGSVWNLHYKNDALILNGESETIGKRENYIELFGFQQKTVQSLHHFFPENTVSYLSFSISDADRFREDLDALFEHRGELDRIKDVWTGTGEEGSFGQDLRLFLGNEFAVVEQKNRTELAFIALSDTASFFRNATGFATADRDSIFRFDRSGMLYAQYGDPLKSFSRPYFVRMGSLIVAANQKNTLKQYRQDWARGSLLMGTPGFQNFERIQGNEANVTCFIQTKHSGELIADGLKPGFREAFQDGTSFGYGNFYGWSVQISGNNGRFLSGVYGIYKSRQDLGGRPEWTYAFGHRPITRPWVFEHSDTSHFILIQEQDHTVHGIHSSGGKMWSAVFSGRVVGDIQQLADRSIVLVTDRNRLYRFDTNGLPLKGFSVALPHRPSHSPTLARIGGQELILIPAGRHLLAYTMAGAPAEGWTDIVLDGNILFDVQAIENEVFVGTENGLFYRFGAYGKPIGKEIAKSRFRNPVLLSRGENGRPALHAVDTVGVLFTVDFDRPPFGKKWTDWGGSSIVSFGNMSRTAFPEMVVLNGKRLSVCNMEDGAEVFGHSFSQDIADRPQFFRDGAGSPLLGLASRGSGLIYLFDESGSVLPGFPIEAFPLFHYGKIDYTGADYLLCLRRDRKMYAFKRNAQY